MSSLAHQEVARSRSHLNDGRENSYHVNALVDAGDLEDETEEQLAKRDAAALFKQEQKKHVGY